MEAEIQKLNRLDVRRDGRDQARKTVGDDKLSSSSFTPADGSVTQAKMASNAIGQAQLKYETASVTISGTSTSGTASVTSGDIILGYYISAISGTPADSGAITASISSTTLTISVQTAPGASTSITIIAVLLKT